MRLALDTSVLISHLKGDEFASQTRRFLRWARRSKHKLVVSDVVYAELYTGVMLGSEPASEEKRVQSLLAANQIEVKLAGTLDIAKRAGAIYADFIRKKPGIERERILPDFLIGAHAEAYSNWMVTWNPRDLSEFLRIPCGTPAQLMRRPQIRRGRPAA